ncbi:MAG TPA: VIT and VWA domain-containing protein [Polyangiaceae bacterium]|nr:VIT and VWA domain-containing protein [Polyangiaceae bacterium]
MRKAHGLVAALVCGALGCASQRPSETAKAAPIATAPNEVFEPGGIGSLEARTSAGDPAQVSLSSVHIVAQQRGDMAEIEATHTFHNEGQSMLEGTFRFPMPDGALLTGLAMMIDGKLMEGELVEREKARKTYEAIVDGMQDPALLEWEHGSVFKMRVFPIEPGQDKVVTIRYLAPLRRQGDALELVQAARGAAGEREVPALSIDWQGRRVFDEKHVAASRVVSFPAKPASAVLRETRPDGNYSVVRVSPDWKRVPSAKRPVPKNWFVVVDTSRSALEELPRELEALRVVLAALPAAARFQVLTSDLEAKPAPQGLSAVTPAAIDEAVRFVESATPDGASDLGRALQVVGGLAKSVPHSGLLYLGDCEPTWGVTRSEDLLALLPQTLPHTPIFPLTFGASVDDDLALELAQRSGGRRARVRRREDLDAFAKTLPIGVPTLDQIEVKSAYGSEVLASGPLSIEQGGELQLLVKAPPGRDPLLGLSVKAKVGGASLDLLPKAPAEDSGGVARRFGAAFVRKLEKTGQPGPDIVKASLDYGVMSKLTSFLVLESEEAYARFAIERKQAQLADAPRVTGANLESSEGADISADRIQPGDPEIVVDAERDALSVKVEFPFGETKLASFDPDARGGRGGWLVRFLVARDTPEGDYEARALIQHADGSLETKAVRYTVDNTAPELEIKLSPAARHPELMEVTVIQPDAGALADLKRVELRTPQGTVYQLVAIRWGTFRAFIPARELRQGTLRVVGFDQALNHSIKELELP